MLSRRDLIASGAALTQLRPAELAAAPATAQSSGDTRQSDTRQIENQLQSIRDALRDLRHPAASADVARIRELQRNFLKLNQRFPECIDVGVRIWERMHDWHLETQQPLKITRSGDGRWQMEFMFTQLVLKTELSDGDFGAAYDR